MEPRGAPLMPEVSPYMAWHLRGGGAGCRRRFRPGKAGSDVESCACGGVYIIPERTLTRSDVVKRAPACCLVLPVNARQGLG